MFLKVGAPREGTRARASGLYMSRPRHRMPSPALFPNARGLPCERGVDGPEERRARVPAPLHEPPRRRKMRFHRVIISPEGRILSESRRGARRDGFAGQSGAQWSGRNEISPRNNLA